MIFSLHTPLIVICIAQAMLATAFHPFANRSWSVSSQTIFFKVNITPGDFPQFDKIEFKDGCAKLHYVDGDGPKKIADFKVRLNSVKLDGLTISLLDQDLNVRFIVLCRMKDKSAEFAFNLDPNIAPTGFDVNSDKIFLLKSKLAK